VSKYDITKNRRAVDLMQSLPSIVPNIADAFVELQTVNSNRKLIFLVCELNDLRCFCSPFMQGSKQCEEAKQMSSPFVESSCKGKGDGILLLHMSIVQVAVVFWAMEYYYYIRPWFNLPWFSIAVNYQRPR